MSKKLNHHFVPQYAFRLFTGGQRYVHGISTRDGSVRKFASIRNQCSRQKFYGDEATEDELSRLETMHAAALHRLEKFTRGSGNSLSGAEDFAIRQAILLQRHRTPRAVNVYNNSMGLNRLAAFGVFAGQIKNKKLRQQALKALDEGRISFRDGDLDTILHGMALAISAVPLVADLKLVILRNRTADPFILSDSPSVAYNLFGWEFKRRGVLGFHCPGLMFFLPITTTVQVVLCDPLMYRFVSEDELFTDVTEPSDVAQLNALQIHTAQENIYFANLDSKEYVTGIYATEAPKVKPLPPGHIIHPPGTMLLDGRPNRDEIRQSFEPQIHHRLRLTVLKYGMAPCENAVIRGRTSRTDKELMAFGYAPNPFSGPNDPLPTPFILPRRNPNDRR